MAHRVDLTLDCANPVELAKFWNLALGYEHAPPPAPYKTRREWLDAVGLPDDDENDGAWLHDPDGEGPALFLQRVPEPKQGKVRLHMDIRVAGPGEPDERWAVIQAKVAELVAAGGSVVATELLRFVVMKDPEGHEFCVG
ncbi:hypothetical protein SAMN05421504_104196 [Amycolatopsis xylanica]|uniref:Glyoxalase-like domain-containing protein n=1 Tax=Amycolatopsis xylanica TaxID=589385 RepID=A0A1H3GC32_9PSEU|nr:VOC family protein [Amycolatopsis xylanica]SDY00600.1 hypothetical protein SAMN05421504_104196 [Amycolatopsis xylanica]